LSAEKGEATPSPSIRRGEKKELKLKSKQYEIRRKKRK
jgi:hypothetical protein